MALVALGIFALSCGGSKANVRTEAAPTNSPPVIDVTTVAAISRDLPRFFEATGSLAGDQQTDVAPSIAGKVVAIGVEMGSYVKRGQMIIRLDDVDSKLRVEQAQAQLEQSKAALRQAEE
ncbi:MAG TPA: biotin/lipoyl-binding protein, partial [Pyrinomonadaceae bacterium]|nr:biotin/lipoyl-binding protein [Pyrinomonadaceae bacterium]